MANRQKMARKQQFVDLYTNEGMGYFKDCRIRLFPNGETGELWIQSKDGRFSVSLKVGMGPAGLGIQVSSHAGTPPITFTGDDTETNYMKMCQYGRDDKSQAFRKWYTANVPYQLLKDPECKECMQDGKDAANQYLEERDSIRMAMADVPLFRSQTPDAFLESATKPEEPQLCECFKRGFWEVIAHV